MQLQISANSWTRGWGGDGKPTTLKEKCVGGCFQSLLLSPDCPLVFFQRILAPIWRYATIALTSRTQTGVPRKDRRTKENAV